MANERLSQEKANQNLHRKVYTNCSFYFFTCARVKHTILPCVKEWITGLSISKTGTNVFDTFALSYLIAFLSSILSNVYSVTIPNTGPKSSNYSSFPHLKGKVTSFWKRTASPAVATWPLSNLQLLAHKTEEPFGSRFNEAKYACTLLLGLCGFTR